MSEQQKPEKKPEIPPPPEELPPQPALPQEIATSTGPGSGTHFARRIAAGLAPSRAPSGATIPAGRPAERRMKNRATATVAALTVWPDAEWIPPLRRPADADAPARSKPTRRRTARLVRRAEGPKPGSPPFPCHDGQEQRQFLGFAA